MPKSVFRFLSRQPDTIELEGADHILRLPRNSDFSQWQKLRAESRRFLEPWEPTWRTDELTEGAYRTRVVRASRSTTPARQYRFWSSSATTPLCSAGSLSVISGAVPRRAA